MASYGIRFEHGGKFTTKVFVVVGQIPAHLRRLRPIASMAPGYGAFRTSCTKFAVALRIRNQELGRWMSP